MQTNFLVIGSGISGLNFALHAAQKGEVILITKKKLIDASTNFAQGGIAAVLDKYDNIENHVADTMTAGAYLNDKKAVRFMVKHSTNAIHRLIELGVKFEKENGKLKLTKEGGHHHRRIAYVGDFTGQEIEKILVQRVKEHPFIRIFENTFALDLITKDKVCYGASVLLKGRAENIFADQTILATGGLGQIFKETTNPKIATGDGFAMGIRAGCELKNMEFIQFHPTAAAIKISPRFLISEAVRGEGAILKNSAGDAFMEDKHPLKDLAPRDIVAREIYRQLKIGPVYLDISHKSRQYLQKRFPQIYAKLQKHGFDMAAQPFPVTPAAHYQCGGIVTDLHGRTKVKNLFAFGEVTYTGVHGANRLASNSLLEALVFSNQIIEKLKPQKNLKVITLSRPKIFPQKSPQTDAAKKLRREIQKLMWQYAGIIRNFPQIKNEAIPLLKKIQIQLQKISGTNQTIKETENMAQAGMLILKSALQRKKSIGCHYIEKSSQKI